MCRSKGKKEKKKIGGRPLKFTAMVLIFPGVNLLSLFGCLVSDIQAIFFLFLRKGRGWFNKLVKLKLRFYMVKYHSWEPNCVQNLVSIESYFFGGRAAGWWIT